MFSSIKIHLIFFLLLSFLAAGALFYFSAHNAYAGSGNILLRTTLDGQPWSGSITGGACVYWAESGKTGCAHNVTWAVPQNYQSVDAPTRWRVWYDLGGPAGAQFQGISPSSFYLQNGGTITVTFQFTSPPQPGRVNINAALDGQPWSGQLIGLASAQNQGWADIPFTTNVPYSENIFQPDTYTLKYSSGGPANATFQSITPSATQTLSSGGAITFTYNFKSVPPQIATVKLQALLDGKSWSGSISGIIKAPCIQDTQFSADLPITINDVPLNCSPATIIYSSGGPKNSRFTGISPAQTQTLSAGQTITFTFNFSTVKIDPNTILPVGYTAVYKRGVQGDKQVWVATRINSSTIVFLAWADPVDSSNIIWRSQSSSGNIVLDANSSEIYYGPVLLNDTGMPANPLGKTIGPGDVWLTENTLYISFAGVTKYAHAQRIGFGALPAWYTRQWCGLNTLCRKWNPDNWDGWPLWVTILQQQGGLDAVLMMIGPFSPAGFETGQGYLEKTGQGWRLRGYDNAPQCTEWTKTLGLCVNDSLYAAGAGGPSFAINFGADTAQWWLYDINRDFIPDCSEFGPTGAQVPDTVFPHGVAAKVTDRGVPIGAESTWQGSTEGACHGTGTIQGYKVPNTDSTVNSQSVYLDGGSQTVANPYFFTNVPSGNHTVSVTVPSGWNVGYTLCYNVTTCHGNTPTSGSSVTVNVPAGGYADLWWHYTSPTPSQRPQWVSFSNVPIAVRIKTGEYVASPPIAEFDWHVWDTNNNTCGAIGCMDRGHWQDHFVYDKMTRRGWRDENGQIFEVRTGETYLAPKTCDPWYMGVGICNNTSGWQVKNYVVEIGRDQGGAPSNSSIRLSECHKENPSLQWSATPPSNRVDPGSAVACAEKAGQTPPELSGAGFLVFANPDPNSESNYITAPAQAQPENLVLSASAGCAGVSLSWNSITGAGAYEAYRNNVKIASLQASAISYQDKSVSLGIQYDYYIRALADGNWIVSNTVSVRVPRECYEEVIEP